MEILDLKSGKDKYSKCGFRIIKVFTTGLGWAKDLFLPTEIKIDS